MLYMILEVFEWQFLWTMREMAAILKIQYGRQNALEKIGNMVFRHLLTSLKKTQHVAKL